MSKRLTNWITIIVIAAALFFGYRFFFVTPAVVEEAGVVAESEVASDSVASGEFLELLLSVKGISLSKAIFDNVIFRDRLKDFGRELPSRIVGRSNPFAPFGVGRVGTTTTGVKGVATSTAATSTPKATTTRSSDNFDTFDAATSSASTQDAAGTDFSF